MSDTGKQSPLGVNVSSSLLLNQGLNINATVTRYVGTSYTNDTYTPGILITDTCLSKLVDAINRAYYNPTSASLYDNLISIGAGIIPALGNSLPPTYTWVGPATTGYAIVGDIGQGQTASWLPYSSLNSDDSITQWGFMRLLALQAWNEFNWNGIPDELVPTYKDFITSFSIAAGSTSYNNSIINTLVNSADFLKGTYSNMNDLMSADIIGVTAATSVFGQDCITAGKVVDLSKIAKFGLPSVLLQTIKKYNAVTPSLSIALLSAGLSYTDINGIYNGTIPFITKRQEQQIYGAFLIIVGQDLINVLIPLNCKTKNLNTLADLLDIKKIFPNSYNALTVPIYSANPGPTNSSKIYYLIFDGDGINSRITTPAVTRQVGTIIPPGTPPISNTTSGNNIQIAPVGFDSYLIDILPNDVAISAGAFSITMQQIKNIQSADFEKFAQVVYSIETTKNLTLLNNLTTPTDIPTVQAATALVALGSGPYGTFTLSDFFGSMSGVPYMWGNIYNSIRTLQTSALTQIYSDLYDSIVAVDPDITIQGHIDAANAEIASILANNPKQAQMLNMMYDAVGRQLTIEQRTRFNNIEAVPIPRSTSLSTYPASIMLFVDALPGLATQTLPHMAAQTLEAIADLSIIGGQSLIAMLRQERNQHRLVKAGIPLDNNISSNLKSSVGKLLLANGTAPIATADGGIPAPNKFDISYTVPSSASDSVGYLDPNTNVLLVVSNPSRQPPLAGIISGIPPVTTTLVPTSGIPLDVGKVNIPGSLAGSRATNLMPNTLSMAYASGTINPSTFTVPEAINEAIRCNCDNWVD